MISEKIGQMGQVVMTRGLYAASSKSKEVDSQIREAFRRYLQRDWGELDAEDKLMNNHAVESPGSDRILAKYTTSAGPIYIITEYDRSATTLLFTDEY